MGKRERRPPLTAAEVERQVEERPVAGGTHRSLRMRVMSRLRITHEVGNRATREGPAQRVVTSTAQSDTGRQRPSSPIRSTTGDAFRAARTQQVVEAIEAGEEAAVAEARRRLAAGVRKKSERALRRALDEYRAVPSKDTPTEAPSAVPVDQQPSESLAPSKTAAPTPPRRTFSGKGQANKRHQQPRSVSGVRDRAGSVSNESVPGEIGSPGSGTTSVRPGIHLCRHCGVNEMICHCTK
jgi:hypothetical protein